MSTKFIKYSVLASCFFLFSCDFIYENYILNDDDEFHGWSCDPSVLIHSFDKAVNPCTYSIKYTNEFSETKGKFQVSFKDANKSYHLYSNEITLSKGQQTINIFLERCNFKDKITAVCFMTYR